MKAQHIHDANAGQGGGEELWPLGHAGAYQQSSVGATTDGELGRGCVLVGDEPLGSSDEVVEDVLFD